MHRFYRKIGWGAHAWHPRRHRHPIAKWVQMAALGAAICNVFKRVGGSITSVSKPYGGLMTVVKQPGEIAAGTLKLSHSPPDSSLVTSPAFIPE